MAPAGSYKGYTYSYLSQEQVDVIDGLIPAPRSAALSRMLDLAITSGSSDTSLPVAGGTMEGDIDMDGNALTGLPEPSGNTDAATKNYVDELAGGQITANNGTGDDIVAGTLLNVSSYAGEGIVRFVLADVIAGRPATHVAIEDIADGEDGLISSGLVTVTGLDTSGYTLNDTIYLSAAGTYSNVATTDYDSLLQVVGTVSVANADGSIIFFTGFSNLRKIGTNGLQDASVTSSKIADGAIGIFKFEGSLGDMISIVGRNETGITIPSGTFVKVIGWSAGSSAYLVEPANGITGDFATHVVSSNFVNNSNTVVYATYQMGGIDTSLMNVGDPIYLVADGGGSTTAPTNPDGTVQLVGSVVTVGVSGVVRFFPGFGLVQSRGTSALQTKSVTRTKIDKITTTFLGQPALATDNAILASTTLLTSNVYNIASGQPDVPRNLTITITGMVATPGATATIAGVNFNGDAITEVFDISAGAGVYTGTKIFVADSTLTTNAIAGLAGTETIRAGRGNRIGLPHDITATSAVRWVYLSSLVQPGTYTVYAGAGVSAIDCSAATYNGTKGMRIIWNEAE